MLIVVLNALLYLRLGLVYQVQSLYTMATLVLGSGLQLRFCLAQVLQRGLHVRLIFTSALTGFSLFVSSLAAHEDPGILPQFLAHSGMAVQESPQIGVLLNVVAVVDERRIPGQIRPDFRMRI